MNEDKKPAAKRAVPKAAYTVLEVAEALGLTKKTIDRMIAKGAIASVKFGTKSRRVTAGQLQEYIEARERDSGWSPPA